jgi:hypothetical protein
MQKISFVYRRKVAIGNYCDKMWLRGGRLQGKILNPVEHVLGIIDLGNQL